MVAIILNATQPLNTDVWLYPVPKPQPLEDDWRRAQNVDVFGFSVVRFNTAGGVVVQAVGYGFTGMNQARIGGESGTLCTAFSVINDNVVQFTTPAMVTGTYSLFLGGGTFGTITITNAFEYDANMAASLFEGCVIKGE
jgi:hypothetical protein